MLERLLVLPVFLQRIGQQELRVDAFRLVFERHLGVVQRFRFVPSLGVQAYQHSVRVFGFGHLFLRLLHIRDSARCILGVQIDLG